jgi:hypothetical protein
MGRSGIVTLRVAGTDATVDELRAATTDNPTTCSPSSLSTSPESCPTSPPRSPLAPRPTTTIGHSVSWGWRTCITNGWRPDWKGMTSDVAAQLRQVAVESIGPTETGYLRPWMSAGDPPCADVFVIGANAATPLASNVVTRDDYIDALMAGGETLRRIYLRARVTGRPSPTRVNTDRLTGLLAEHGTEGVFETNVWTMPTASLRELQRTQRNTYATALPRLVAILRPKALIVHGATATQGLAKSLGRLRDRSMARRGRTDRDLPPIPRRVSLWNVGSLGAPRNDRSRAFAQLVGSAAGRCQR